MTGPAPQVEQLAALLLESQRDAKREPWNPFYGHEVAEWLIARGVTLGLPASREPSEAAQDEPLESDDCATHLEKVARNVRSALRLPMLADLLPLKEQGDALVVAIRRAAAERAARAPTGEDAPPR